MAVQILQGDCRDVLATLPEGSVQCVVSSPPYWGLRDYGTAAWDGGDPACDHTATRRGHGPDEKQVTSAGTSRDRIRGEDCRRCGATRIDQQIGLEPTPEAYVATMVEVFRQVRRVLRDDGTCWVNLGDAFADKQLLGMPWRVAFALQADGWWLRSEIIWAKSNPMPESVTDRPTKAHEQVFLLTKRPTYFYDADAVREPHTTPVDERRQRKADGVQYPGVQAAWSGIPGNGRAYAEAGRNLRSVWIIPSEPTPDAHFATFPRKLVAPCILAGTSARGCCAACGAPWARVVDAVNSDRAGSVSTTTTGWQPTCDHDAPVVPCVVLDCFGGTGTTARVAEDLGRDSILVELNADYVALARRKTAQLGLFAGRADDGA